MDSQKALDLVWGADAGPDDDVELIRHTVKLLERFRSSPPDDAKSRKTLMDQIVADAKTVGVDISEWDASEPPPPPEEDEAPAATAAAEPADEPAAEPPAVDLGSMTKAQLLSRAEDLGITVSATSTKPVIIEAIEAAAVPA